MKYSFPLSKFYSKVVTILGILFFWILLFEFALQIGSSQLTAIDQVTGLPIKTTIADPLLGRKGNPEFRGHDENGFRNPLVPIEVNFVALGDSHTYGTSVGREDAWPSVLSHLLSKTGYNMGLGGYGPTHNAHNIHQALSLRPQLIIFGFYFGNDFYDSFSHYKENGTLKSKVSKSQLQKILYLESQGTIGAQASFLYRRGRGRNGITPMRKLLSQYSKLYGLLRTAKRILRNTTLPTTNFETAVKNLTPTQLQFSSVFQENGWKTIFTAPYRNLVLNDSDLRNRTGVELSKQAIKKMDTISRSKGTDFLVALLPTKETVFAPKVSDWNRHKELQSLISNEARLRNELIQFFGKHGIKFINLVPPLRNATTQPYFESANGHPNRLGHQIIAIELARYIQEAQG